MTVIPLPPNPMIATLGDFVADLVCTIPSLPVEADLHQIAHSILVEPGGAGNFVIAAHRLGLDATLLGVMGTDAFGNLAAQALESEGIDTSGLIRQSNGTTTTVIALVDDDSRHVFLGAYGSGPQVTIPADWFERLKAISALFISGYSLHEERLCAAVLQAIEFARAHAVPIFFDPGPHVRDLPGELIRKVIGMTRVLLLTDEEIPLVTGGRKGLDDCRRLLEDGPELICVKRGAQGCILMTRDQQISHPGFLVPVRDTAAAGDSFAAAFIYGYLCAWPLPGIAAFANAMGAAKVQKLGSGTKVPTLDEVLAVLLDNNVIIQFQ
ncbi:MAG: carbohydrate kinase family protein [Chloroflexi bacterium]|nr:carbohydrate kinase family protein [Chloroflexota bacterium]